MLIFIFICIYTYLYKCKYLCVYMMYINNFKCSNYVCKVNSIIVSI